MNEFDLRVHAGPHARRDCPLVVELPASAAGKPSSATLTLENGESLPGQILPPTEQGDHLRIAFILSALEPEAALRISVELSDASPSPEKVTVSDDAAGSVTVEVAGDLLTVYRYQGLPARPCFFPLLGPGGKSLTRHWPMSEDVPDEPQDHEHHRSMWVAHGDVNGTDNWLEEEGHGFQLHRKLLAAAGGPVLGRLAALNDWTDPQQNKTLEERRTLIVYAVSPDARLFDLDVCLTATECDVRFGDTKEGGLIAFRVAPAMDGTHTGRITNSYGAGGEAECWGRRAHWCDYTGEIGGERLGIAVFDHPASFRHPTHWHVRDYGMYTANPFGWHDFHEDPAVDGSHVLPRGASLNFKYRVYLHRGDAAQASVHDRYHDYANPPRVEILSA